MSSYYLTLHCLQFFVIITAYWWSMIGRYIVTPTTDFRMESKMQEKPATAVSLFPIPGVHYMYVVCFPSIMWTVTPIPTVTPSPLVTNLPDRIGGVNVAAAVAIPVVLVLLLVIGVVVVGAVIYYKMKGLCYKWTVLEAVHLTFSYACS